MIKECVICGAGFEVVPWNKSRCSKACNAVYKSQTQRTRNGTKSEYKNHCRNCNSVFISSNRNSRICSDECRREIKNKARPHKVKKCIVCNLEFSTKYGSSKTCSEPCSYARLKYIRYDSKQAKTSRRIYAETYNKSPHGTKSSVKTEFKRQLGTEPPADLVEEATALRLLNRALRS